MSEDMKSAKDEKKSRRLAKSVLHHFARGGYQKVIISLQAQEFGSPLAPSCVIFQTSNQSSRPLVVSEEDAPFLIHGIKEIANLEDTKTQIGQIPVSLRDERLNLTINFVIHVRIVNSNESEKLLLSVTP